MLPELPQTFLDWVLVIGAAGAVATAVSTSWLAYLSWRPPLRKAKAKVYLQEPACSDDKICLLLHSAGRVDLEVLEIGLSFGYKRYVWVEFQPEDGSLIIRPGGWSEQTYQWPPESDPVFGTLSRWGFYGMKFRIDTPNGLVFAKVRHDDRDWIKGELRKRMRNWKTKTFLDGPPDSPATDH